MELIATQICIYSIVQVYQFTIDIVSIQLSTLVEMLVWPLIISIQWTLSLKNPALLPPLTSNIELHRSADAVLLGNSSKLNIKQVNKQFRYNTARPLVYSHIIGDIW
jgi:hypothetical protein